MADGTSTIDAGPCREIGIPAHAVEANGRYYMADPKGALVPLETVKTTDLLMDEQVRKIMVFARDLNAQIARFKDHTLGDVADLLAVFDQEHQVKLGGIKGNVTLTSFDSTLKVQLAYHAMKGENPDIPFIGTGTVVKDETQGRALPPARAPQRP